MRSTTLLALSALLLSGVALGCGDDGKSPVEVGDPYDAGGDSGEPAVNNLSDAGPILGGGCDAAAGSKCGNHKPPPPGRDGADAGDDGGSNDAG